MHISDNAICIDEIEATRACVPVTPDALSDGASLYLVRILPHAPVPAQYILRKYPDAL